MTQRPERSPTSRLRSNVRWNLLGNATYALGQWVQLIILARVGGASAVGAYAFALALTAPVMMLASLCLRYMQASDARGTYAFREYLSLRVTTTAAAVLAVVIIAWASGAGQGAWAVLLPVCVMRSADAIADVYYGVWQKHERMGVIAAGLVLNSGTSIALMTCAALLGAGVPGAAIGSALGSSAALVFARMRTASATGLRAAIAPGSEPLAWRRVARLAVEATPLGVTVLLGSLQQNVPRFFVRHYLGEAALGVFAAASQLTTGGDIVIAALGNAATPRLASLRASGDVGSFRAFSRKLVLAGALLGVAGVALSAVAGRSILVLLYRPEFGSGAIVLLILSAAAGIGFVASLFGYTLSSARIFAVQPALLVAALTVLVACCTVLVPRHGAEGAAWALAIAYSVHAFLSWWVLRRSHVEARKIAGAPRTQAA